VIINENSTAGLSPFNFVYTPTNGDQQEYSTFQVKKLLEESFSFEAFMAVIFQVKVFWVVTPCSVVVKMKAAWTSETSVT
jgi:hypothetical protein